MGRRHWSAAGFGGIEVVMVVGLLAGLGGGWWVLGRSPGPWPGSLIELRPPAVGAERFLGEGVVETTRATPGVVTATPYLAVALATQAPEDHHFLVGIVPGPPPPALPGLDVRGALRLKLLKGRGLRAEDAGKPVALIGARYAGRLSRPGEAPPVGAPIGLEVWKTEAEQVRVEGVEVVGVFATGNRRADGSVFTPLLTAQRLLGLEGKVSGVLVTVKADGDRPTVAEQLRARLGESVDVVLPSPPRETAAGPDRDRSWR